MKIKINGANIGALSDPAGHMTGGGPIATAAPLAAGYVLPDLVAVDALPGVAGDRRGNGAATAITDPSVALVALTPTQIGNGLLSGYSLSSAQFTYSIPTATSFWETTPGNYTGVNQQPFQTYSLLDTAQAAAFRAAIAAWDSLIARNFAEVADNAVGHGEVRVAFTSNQMDASTAGYAFQGSNQTPTSIVGDVWLNSSTVGQAFAAGTNNYLTFLHEIGHVLGLKHPFEGTTIPAPYDEQRYTVMSYTSAKPFFSRGFASTQGGGITTTSARVIVTTPGVLDIAAVQSLYGAETTTASGNTTYTFDPFNTALQTIYDAGGTDTWDLSTSTRNNIIDIRPGAYSSVNYWTIAEQIAYWQAQFPGFNNFIANQLNNGDTNNGGPWYEWKDNVGITFSTTIENVIGGSGNDTIIGNDADNLFNLSKGGNDTVDGGAGNDGFYFGATFNGSDVLDGGAGALDQVALQGNYLSELTLQSSSLVNVEQVVLLSGADTSYGDTANNSYSYNLRLIDANVAAGQVLSFSANTLRAGENFTLQASAETNGQIVTYGGAGIDTITGGQQNDGFFFGIGLWGANDRVDGQGGSFDQLAIQGNYAGTSAITFAALSMVGVENLVLLSGGDQRFGNGGTSYSYTITTNDNNVAAGASLAVSANTLTATEVLTLNAQAETNGTYVVYSGAGNDQIRLGAGNDTVFGGGGNDLIIGGGGADQLRGGTGNDTFAYLQVTDSTAASQDRILDFAIGDKIDLSGIGSFAFVSGGFTGSNQLHVIDQGAGTYLVEAETTGDNVADLSILVTSDHALSRADFVGTFDPASALSDPRVDMVAPAVDDLGDTTFGGGMLVAMLVDPANGEDMHQIAVAPVSHELIMMEMIL